MLLLTLLLMLLLQVTGSMAQDFQAEVRERLAALESQNWYLSRALLLQQVAMEEYRRANGDSGITVIRNFRDGTQPYHSATHTSLSAIAVHNHANTVNTCGLGELDVVLNGVHFRTRHNDFPLAQPSTTSGDYHAVENIKFPEVPPAVLNAGNVDAQIREMREWFKAWQTGDITQRDYRPYFKPLLCYLEGAWTEDSESQMTEPFKSYLHKIYATSWWELQEMNRFTAWTGDKDFMENVAHLPTAVVNVTDDGKPVMAQWNYRILCHPIKGGLELSELKLVDDVSSRLSVEKSWSQYSKSRAARFSINPLAQDKATYSGTTRLDEIMAQIPGKDNYGAFIKDAFKNQNKQDVRTQQPLNAAFYHRSYLMFDSPNYRGFNDRSMFVAQTTQPRVTPVRSSFCLSEADCRSYTKRVSVAIPLELVFLTPLQSWNPYNIQNKGAFDSPSGKTVKTGGRNGGSSAAAAYNGVNSMNYFLTPKQFFTGPEIEVDPIDAKQTSASVLDPSGNVRVVSSSGLRVLLPEIPGVGVVRTRYPVFPVHAEGNTAMKEVEALTKIVMQLKENTFYLHKAPNF